ncbi:MAG: hypothetical protein K0R80_2755 [Clostridia bacterium]|jgi:fumarate reductase flavoprotein subunit/urocanate reductase|nr:hypothetical protein [Clostridia bacterium]
MKKRSLLFGIMLVLILSLVFVGCSQGIAAPAWKDGTYSGKAEGVHGDIEVNVEISKGKIAKVNIASENETEGVSDLALEQIPTAIVEKQSVEVETVAGATVSSKAIIAAVEAALSQAK